MGYFVARMLAHTADEAPPDDTEPDAGQTDTGSDPPTTKEGGGNDVPKPGT